MEILAGRIVSRAPTTMPIKRAPKRVMGQSGAKNFVK